MKTKQGWTLVLGIMTLCSHCAGGAVSSRRAPQYAYIGSARGIFEFRVKPDGSLQPLRNGPVKGGTIREVK